MKAQLLALAALALGGVAINSNRREYRPEPKRISKLDRDEQARNKGLSLFHINGQEIWALNRKNAERKANKSA